MKAMSKNWQEIAAFKAKEFKQARSFMEEIYETYLMLDFNLTKFNKDGEITSSQDVIATTSGLSDEIIKQMKAGALLLVYGNEKKQLIRYFTVKSNKQSKITGAHLFESILPSHH